jgi:DNA-binding NtrC family response regulator
MEGQTKRILLVEDDRFLRKAAEATLRSHGFAVCTAADGEEALQRIQAEVPDLVLLDLIMPKLQGFEVLHILKQNPATQQIPVMEQITGRQVVPYLSPESAIQRAHLLYKGDLREMLERSVANETSTVAAQRRPGGEDYTAVNLVTRTLEYAAVTRASDIHIEPYEMERQDTSAIRAEAIARGMKTMFQDGLAKVFIGETTLEEIFRVAL